jgi:hypothetical protein
MALITFPKAGTLVEYHGSMAERHGVYLVMGDCECLDCEQAERDSGPMEYRLSLVNALGICPVQLDHVRLESVSLA